MNENEKGFDENVNEVVPRTRAIPRKIKEKAEKIDKALTKRKIKETIEKKKSAKSKIKRRMAKSSRKKNRKKR